MFKAFVLLGFFIYQVAEACGKNGAPKAFCIEATLKDVDLSKLQGWDEEGNPTNIAMKTAAILLLDYIVKQKKLQNRIFVPPPEQVTLIAGSRSDELQTLIPVVTQGNARDLEKMLDVSKLNSDLQLPYPIKNIRVDQGSCPKPTSSGGSSGQTPGPSAPGPSAPGPAAPGPSTLGPAAPGPATPGPSAPGPSAPGPAAPGPTAPGPSTPGPAAPGPSAPGPSAPSTGK